MTVYSLNMQTPEVRLPFPVSEYFSFDNVKYSFQCSQDNMEGNKVMMIYLQSFDIDEAVRNYAKI